jgi:NAD(P)-dependent dehydrogenase (short-subunit alcohol dehydrogenase family)
MREMKEKICMVTGANSGVGKYTALGLARMGATVVMVCRDLDRGRAAQQEIKALSGSDSVELFLADLSSQSSIRRLAPEFTARHQRLHVMVNNAGGYFLRRWLSEDGLELTFALNHLGFFLLTNLLLDAIIASAPARIINVASRAHWASSIQFDDLQRRNRRWTMDAYGQSKLANILFTYELARRLQGTGVTVNCLHPGFVASNFAKNNGLLARIGVALLRPLALSPEKGAETPIYLASSPEVEGITGKYFVDRREAPSNAESYDKDVARRLWEVSEQLVKL